MSLPRRGFLGFLASIPAAIMAPAKLFSSETPEAPRPPRPLPLLCKDVQATLIDESSAWMRSGYSQVHSGASEPVTYTTTTSACSGNIYYYSCPQSNVYDISGMLYVDPGSKKIGFEYRGKWGSARYEIDLEIFERILGPGDHFEVWHMTMITLEERREILVRIMALSTSVNVSVLDHKDIIQSTIYFPRADVESLIQEYRKTY